MERIVARKLTHDVEKRNVLPFPQTKEGTEQEKLPAETQPDSHTLSTKDSRGRKKKTTKNAGRSSRSGRCLQQCNSNCWWNSLYNVASAWRSQDGLQQHSRKERSPCDLETGSPRPNNWRWDFHKTPPCHLSSTMSTQKDWYTWTAMV